MNNHYTYFIRYIPTTLTLLNAFCGVLSILIVLQCSSSNYILYSCLLILLGAIFDGLDGKMARKYKAESEIGKQLDSFADIISFGIAPVCIFIRAYFVICQQIATPIQIILVSIYVICAIYRLAKYNISGCKLPYFVGVPITFSGSVICIYTSITMIAFPSFCTTALYPFISFGLIMTLSLLMISSIKVRKPFS